MIKLVQCVRKQAEIELLEFRRYWDEYRLILEKAQRELGISRLLFSTTLAVDENFELMLARGTRTPYDGIVEVYFENATILREGIENPGADSILEEIRKFQEEFMDLSASTFFFALNDRY